MSEKTAGSLRNKLTKRKLVKHQSFRLQNIKDFYDGFLITYIVINLQKRKHRYFQLSRKFTNVYPSPSAIRKVNVSLLKTFFPQVKRFPFGFRTGGEEKIDDTNLRSKLKVTVFSFFKLVTT